MARPSRIHRIRIETPTTSRDTRGGVTKTWAPFAVVWAAVRSLSGTEVIAAQQRVPESTHEMDTYYISGVTPKMRVVFDGSTYDVLAAIDPDHRKRDLKIMARVVAN